MSDRLPNLLRQRTIIEEHLRWLDREIAAASENRLPIPDENLRPIPAPGSARPSVPIKGENSGEILRADGTGVDPLLADYVQEPENLKADVKRGCLIYFSVGMSIMLLSVFLLYLHYAHRAPAAPPPPATVPISTR